MNDASRQDSLELDGLDCFNGDLEWILSRLVERASGTAGWVLRFVRTDATPTVLASVQTTDHRCAIDTEVLAAEIQNTERSSGVTGELVHTTHAFRSHAEDPHEIRVLYMRFTPANGVNIVAAVCRPARTFALLQDAVVRRLHPVLERYVRLWWMHRSEKRRADAFQGAIDLADIGVVMLNMRAEPISSNTYASRLQPQHQSMPWRDGSRLTAQTTEAQRLRTAIHSAMLMNSVPDQRGTTRSGTMLTVRREKGVRPLIVTVLPVRRPAVDPEDPAVILVILDPSRDVAALLGPASQVYRLTPAERRLVEHLVSGDSLTDAAVRMQISIQTGRGYLKRVFEKTETNRQAELVSVMFASALRASIGLDIHVL